MNATIDTLLNRKSIRVYSDEPITSSEKETILQAAMRAPTAGNMMLYSILEIEDQALKERLAETCDHQPFIAKAPYVLVFLADYQRWYDSYLANELDQAILKKGQTMRRLGEGDLLLACVDTVIAAQTAVIAAESLGIGSCYIGDIIENFEVHRELLGLPQYVLPVAMVCFGRPTPEQAARQQPTRFGEEFVVHKNRYQQLSAAQLEQMFQPRNAQFSAAGQRKDGIENVVQLNFFKKFNAEFSHEMTRSVHAMIESWNQP